ncbi:MAG: hypothetical protein FJ026_10390, partial [Chloroflexi bacterium]|nr:hypothetical protein [Chloroflexota bacterium]
GAQAVLSGNLGPNAFDVFQAAGVPCFLIAPGTLRQAVEAFKAGRLQAMGGANVAAHAGLRGGGPTGMGQSMGRGMGPVSAPPPEPAPSKETELAALHETLRGLRQQLAETMERIDKLEKGD